MSNKPVQIPNHHVKGNVCATRKPYREGRKPKAVKVYTINNESRYILIQGVPSVGASENLVNLCSKFGEVEEHHALDEYPCEDQYTEVYLFKFKKIQSARFAKKKLDDYSFFGGVLHLCYAPEYETIVDTREKLQERRRIIASKLKRNGAVKESARSKSFESQKTQPIASAGLSNLSRCSGQSASDQMELKESAQAFNVSRLSAPMDQINHYTSHSSSSQTVQNSLHPPDPYTAAISNFPRQSQSLLFLPHSVRGRSNSEFPHTASSHASLHPQGNDGHVIQRPEPIITKTYQSDKNHNASCSSHPHSNQGVKSIKEKFDRDKVLIKDYKKSGSVPKFVPRQATKRSASDSRCEIDKLDQEIRQNAFNLGQIQGPEQDEKAVVSPIVPPAVDKSVRNTILSIRSKNEGGH